MSLSPDEAADALRDIAAVEARSQHAYAYREASPHLILWGVLWAVGDTLSSLVPRRDGAIWIAIVTVGTLAGYAIAYRAAIRRNAQAGTPIAEAARRAAAELRWTFNAIQFIAAIFIAASLAVMAPVGPRQIGAFIPLVVAGGYAVMGLWLGLRFTVAGAVLAALTLGGFFLLPAYFTWWMAAAGGGSLILGGLWLRRA